MIKRFLVPIFLTTLIWSCSNEETPGPELPSVDDFNRGAMLVHWADNIIVPAYQSFATKTENLKGATESFINAPNSDQLNQLRNSFLEAQLEWQKVSMFEIGKAESIRLRNNINIYPADVAGIEENIELENYNLELPSQIDRQGFPAIEYLLYGMNSNIDEILSKYKNDTGTRKSSQYLIDLVVRMDNLADEVVSDWTSGGFRDVFVQNDGNSATASLDKVVNDYLFYYEKALRAGKIGIPAGVFSGNPLPNHVEGLYSQDHSKTLFLTALQASIDFFNGKNFNGSGSGDGLAAYINFIATTGNANAENLSSKINQQFTAALQQANNVQDNFNEQVLNDNTQLLRLYDELQKNVINLKVDMLQALNVNVDYVDADGD